MIDALSFGAEKSFDGKPKFRFCVDFRALNSVTKFDPYPLQVFEEATARLHSSKNLFVLRLLQWLLPDAYKRRA